MLNPKGRQREGSSAAAKLMHVSVFLSANGPGVLKEVEQTLQIQVPDSKGLYHSPVQCGDGQTSATLNADTLNQLATCRLSTALSTSIATNLDHRPRATIYHTNNPSATHFSKTAPWPTWHSFSLSLAASSPWYVSWSPTSSFDTCPTASSRSPTPATPSTHNQSCPSSHQV